ncbi:hypothetical protein F5884DRAFT_83675 [Xylogone sp. PMI_703]|nr:hypothetical protein F5884DRAFT_83675 [Xylogone sp. PMI_703]
MSIERAQYHLIGTYTRYSSWTARVVTVLEYFKIPYKANYVPLSEVKSLSPSGFVPLLQDPSLSPIYLNDSLAICEFLADSHPDLNLWPQDRFLRALARSAAAEMHSGFSVMRNTYDTNFIAKYTGKIPITDAGLKEIERMLKLWGDSRMRSAKRLKSMGKEDEGFLFGSFSIADAYFWPVLWRFRTYNLPLDSASPEALAWMAKMWSDPVMKALGKDYFKQVENPETKIDKYDDKYKGNKDITYGTFEEDWEFFP